MLHDIIGTSNEAAQNVQNARDEGEVFQYAAHLLLSIGL